MSKSGNTRKTFKSFFSIMPTFINTSESVVLIFPKVVILLVSYIFRKNCENQLRNILLDYEKHFAFFILLHALEILTSELLFLLQILLKAFKNVGMR